MAMAGRSAARRRRPENLGNMCKSARASGTEESLGLESGLRQFKNPTKLRFSEMESCLCKSYGIREKSGGNQGLRGVSARVQVSQRENPTRSILALWIPMQKAMAHGSGLRAEGSV